VSGWNNSANLPDQVAISTPDKIGKSHNNAQRQTALRFSPKEGIRINSNVALQNPTHAQRLRLDRDR
jgi:hypothetical protein